MLTDVVIEDERWAVVGLPDLAERAARAALAELGHDPAAYEISVLACDDARIAVLNAEFRDKRAATNVLSWPAQEIAPQSEGAQPPAPAPDPFAGETQELGDIAIAYDTCAREAGEAGTPLADHATHLVVHAVLHLLGYDHIRDKDATLMEGLEVRILGKLGLPDPYNRAKGA
ncbi:MAG: rRNA maturation RNase YbeY [Sediminimonas sp.]|uniref:rRNA maturation RNase YbeY n=1 Tax=Sediminimonas sp. TaxID=2823379 RepID=UPI00286FED22|nr:rRNA maturation RNase YbeY [Sediminimonas sp.]MDR9483853.1 rRNA maturation RNase YbeY [Sediminimonas sp.]